MAAAAGTHVERLQCYRGVSEDKAIGRFDESLQRLYMEFSKGQHENWQSVQASLKGRDFFQPGPLMRALESERPCVLLIDELDKVDDGFEVGRATAVRCPSTRLGGANTAATKHSEGAVTDLCPEPGAEPGCGSG